MSKLWTRGVILVFCLLVPVFFAPTASAASNPEKTPNQSEEIVVAVPRNFPPYYLKDSEGRHQGFSVVIMNHIADLAGLRPRYLEKQNWSEVLASLRDGEAQVIPVFLIDPRQGDFLRFTSPLETDRLAVFIRREDKRHVNKLSDLAKQPVAVINNPLKLTEHYPEHIEIVPYNNLEKALLALISGKVRGLICSEHSVWDMARRSGLNERISVLSETLRPLERGMAVRADEEALYRRLEQAVQTFLRTPEFNRFYENWHPKPPPFWSLGRIAGLSALFVLGVLLVGLFWRYRMNIGFNRRLQVHIREQDRITQKLLESEKRFHSFFEYAVAPMLIHDMRGHLQEANRSACLTLGHAREEIEHLLISDIWHPESPERTERPWEYLKPDQGLRLDGYYCRRDGSCFPVEIDLGVFSFNGQPLVLQIARDVTDKRRAERDLRDSEARYRGLFDTLNVGISLNEILYDRNDEPFDYRILDVNPAYGHILGITREQALGALASELYPGHAPPFLETFAKIAETGRARGFETELLPNRFFNLSASAAGAGRFAVVFEDVTARRRSEAALRQAAMVLENINEGVLITDRDLVIQAVNPAFSTITGYSTEEVVGQTPRMLKSGRQDKRFYHEMYQRLSSQGNWAGEIWNRRKNGEIYPEWLSISGISDESGQVSGYVAIFSDITQRKRNKELLWRQANFDQLTDLPNRMSFTAHLRHLLNNARAKGERVALLIVDLDRFKWINDSLGHEQGDKLLVEAARRLQLCPPENKSLARFGGDEFSIVLTNIHQVREAEDAARKVVECLGGSIRVGGHETFISCSIGITLFPTDGNDADTLIRKANAAMYRAREGSQDRFRFYAPEMDTQAHERVRLERDLRYALERREFMLHYQPVIDLASGWILGAEVLIRWRHPLRGLMRPDRFIPLAEETGLIVPLSEWVLETVCRQGQAWLAAGLPPADLAINISRRLFQEEDLDQRIAKVLTQTGFPAHHLSLEITESLVMEEAETAIEKMNRLKELGVRYLLDDFGTGYSSLSYLKRLPVDILKIDRSFVGDVSKSREAALLEAIVVMAHSLGMGVVGEGVETAAQAAFLKRIGCEYGQGYYFSFPLVPEEFAKLLKSRVQRTEDGGQRSEDRG